MQVKTRNRRKTTCAQAVKLAKFADAIPSNTVPAIAKHAAIKANTHPAIKAVWYCFLMPIKTTNAPMMGKHPAQNEPTYTNGFGIISKYMNSTRPTANSVVPIKKHNIQMTKITKSGGSMVVDSRQLGKMVALNNCESEKRRPPRSP